MASTYLNKTPSSAGNRAVWTWSGWLKFSSFDNFYPIFTAGDWSGGSTATGFILYLGQFYTYWNSPAGGTSTSAKFRDVNGWYHVVLQANTSTLKLYVNNVEMSSKSISGNGEINNTSEQAIGRYSGSTSAYFDGEMAHVHFTDGTAYSPSDFGETDSTTGIWKPKTAPSVTYGTNGFFLKFENSGAFGTDSSGNSNTFTVNGTMTQTIDTPSNVFATLNPLYKTVACTLSNGNTRSQITTTTSKYAPGSTLKVSSGKWYAEFKCNSTGGAQQQAVGIYGDEQNASSNDQGVGKANDSYSWRSDGEWMVDNTGSPDFNSYGSGDIISIALDLDNNYLYFAKNGVWENSGDPTSGATGTGGKSITAASGVVDGVYSMGAGSNSSGNLSDWSSNFGNGYFGTTAVSSAQNPDDGIGIFEYDVPTGYRALCTKSINAEEYS